MKLLADHPGKAAGFAIASSLLGAGLCSSFWIVWYLIFDPRRCGDLCGTGLVYLFFSAASFACVYGLLVAIVAAGVVTFGGSRSIFIAITVALPFVILSIVILYSITPKIGHYYAAGWSDHKLPGVLLSSVIGLGSPMVVTNLIFLWWARKYAVSELDEDA